MPCASTSWNAQPSAPSGSKPMGRSCMTGMAREARGQLPVDLELQPLVETDAIRHRTLRRDVAHRGRRRMAELVRPAVPAGLEPLGERAEDRELLEAGALLRRERVELRKIAAADAVPDPLEDAHLEPEDLVAIDPSILVERPRAYGDRGHDRRASLPRPPLRFGDTAGCGTGGSTESTGWLAAARPAWRPPAG